MVTMEEKADTKREGERKEKVKSWKRGGAGNPEVGVMRAGRGRGGEGKERRDCYKHSTNNSKAGQTRPCNEDPVC